MGGCAVLQFFCLAELVFVVVLWSGLCKVGICPYISFRFQVTRMGVSRTLVHNRQPRLCGSSVLLHALSLRSFARTFSVCVCVIRSKWLTCAFVRTRKVCGHDSGRVEPGYGPLGGRRSHVGLAEQVEGPRRLPVGVRQVSGRTAGLVISSTCICIVLV